MRDLDYHINDLHRLRACCHKYSLICIYDTIASVIVIVPKNDCFNNLKYFKLQEVDDLLHMSDEQLDRVIAGVVLESIGL